MLYKEIIAVCSQIHTKHINTLCGRNVEVRNVKQACTYSNHLALKDVICVDKKSVLWESRLCEVRSEVFCKVCLFACTCSMEPPPEVVVLTYRLCAAPRVGGPTAPAGYVMS